MFKENKNFRDNLFNKIEEADKKSREDIRDSIKNYCPVKTGQLKESIKVEGNKILTKVIYSKIQEFGGFISAKNKDYLKFKIGNAYRTVKSVFIEANPFFRPGIESAKSKILNNYKGLINK